jgi:hypothetical protein
MGEVIQFKKPMTEYEEVKDYFRNCFDNVLNKEDMNTLFKILDDCEKDGYSIQETLEMLEESIDKAMGSKS